MDPIHRTHDIKGGFRKVHGLHYTLAKAPGSPSHLHSVAAAHSNIVTLLLRKHEGVWGEFDTEVIRIHPDHNIFYYLPVTAGDLIHQIHRECTIGVDPLDGPSLANIWTTIRIHHVTW